MGAGQGGLETYWPQADSAETVAQKVPTGQAIGPSGSHKLDWYLKGWGEGTWDTHQRGSLFSPEQGLVASSYFLPSVLSSSEPASGFLVPLVSCVF